MKIATAIFSQAKKIASSKQALFLYCFCIITMNGFPLQIPETPEAWKKIAEDFQITWNVPHCIGAIDGKHITMQSPIKSGTEFYNYKHFFSVVLMAAVDANYSFTFADVGCQGRLSDGAVFRNTELFQKLENHQLNLPEDELLTGEDIALPYVFVADDAFALSRNILKPYPGMHNKGSQERIFNYRLSRARRIIENVFGIMASVFRVLRKPMLLQPRENVPCGSNLCAVP